MKRWIKGMRDSFFDALFEIAKKDRNVILITADTGAICHDKFKQELSNQYINVGIAEQNMIGVAAGLALAGKKVYVYAIIPFVTMRCYEQIRVDLCCMNLPVTVVGIGAGFDYSTLGPTHHGTEDIALMRALPGMQIYSPCDSLMAEVLLKATYKQKCPRYIRLDRTGVPLAYKDNVDIDISSGFTVLKEGEDMCIIATGRMVYSALQAAKKLSDSSISVKVIDLFRIKPLNQDKLWNEIKHIKNIVTLEEHFLEGGIGDLVGKMLLAKNSTASFKSIGIKDEFCRKYGSREYLYRINKLDVDSIIKSVKNIVKYKKLNKKI